MFPFSQGCMHALYPVQNISKEELKKLIAKLYILHKKPPAEAEGFFFQTLAGARFRSLDFAQILTFEEAPQLEPAAGERRSRQYLDRRHEILHRRYVNRMDQAVDVVVIGTPVVGVDGRRVGSSRDRRIMGAVRLQADTRRQHEARHGEIVLLTNVEPEDGVLIQGHQVRQLGAELGDQADSLDGEPLGPAQLASRGDVGEQLRAAGRVLEQAVVTTRGDFGGVVDRLVDGLQFDFAALGVLDGTENRHDSSLGVVPTRLFTGDMCGRLSSVIPQVPPWAAYSTLVFTP